MASAPSIGASPYALKPLERYAQFHLRSRFVRRREGIGKSVTGVASCDKSQFPVACHFEILPPFRSAVAEPGCAFPHLGAHAASSWSAEAPTAVPRLSCALLNACLHCCGPNGGLHRHALKLLRGS